MGSQILRLLLLGGCLAGGPSTGLVAQVPGWWNPCRAGGPRAGGAGAWAGRLVGGRGLESSKNPVDDPLRASKQLRPGDVDHLEASLTQKPVSLELLDCLLAAGVLHQPVGLGDRLLMPPQEVDLVLVVLADLLRQAVEVHVDAGEDIGLHLRRR